MRENSAHKKQICTISEKNRHNPIDMVSTTATTTITTKPSQRWRRFVVVKTRSKNERGRNIHIAVVLCYVYKKTSSFRASQTNESDMNVPLVREKIFSRFRFEWAESQSRWENEVEVLRWHSYWEDIITQNTQVIFRDAKILTRDSIIIILITGIGSTFVRSKMCTGKRYHLVWHCVRVCSYSLPLPGAYHADELVNIWRAHFSFSLASVRLPANFIRVEYISLALTRFNRVWARIHVNQHPAATTQYSGFYPFFMMAKLSGTIVSHIKY